MEAVIVVVVGEAVLCVVALRRDLASLPTSDIGLLLRCVPKMRFTRGKFCFILRLGLLPVSLLTHIK